MGQDLLPVSDK